MTFASKIVPTTPSGREPGARRSMTIKSRARVAVAVLSVTSVTAAAMTMSGCGASDALDPVARAAEVTQSLPGAQIALSAEVVSPLGSKPLRYTGHGFVSNHPLTADIRLDFSHLGARRSGPHLADMRILRHVFFMRFPLLSAQLHGKQWLKIDEARTAKAAGLGNLPSTDELDPDQYLTYLRSVSGGLTGIGGQRIHAVPTTGYRGEIDLEKVAQQAPADRRSATVAAVGNLERVTGVSSIPFQVWIDGAGRVRRVSLAEGESSTNADAVKVYITIDFLRFGPERPALAPPASEVFDATAAAASALKAQLRQ
jgi:hypothetical protein